MSLECQAKTQPSKFNASVNLSSFYNHALAHIKADAHLVSRSAAMISKDHKSCFYINYQKSGHCLLRDHLGVQRLIRPGESFIVSSNEFFRMEFDGQFEHFTIEVPHTELSEAAVQPGKCLSPKNPEDRILSEAIRIIEEEFCQRLDNGHYESLLNQCVALLNTHSNLKSNLDEHSHLAYTLSEKVQITSIKKYILKNLLDPNLSVDSISGRFNCSRRTIYRSFENEDLTLSQFITKERIELSKTFMLKNPKISITEVCFRCGFSDSSNFSKKFREYVGITPKDFKTACCTSSEMESKISYIQ